ncbi:MAG: FHA domain-containing protein [Deltaproteobacteria bacterium]|nr:FHA domain-containing protein [Deltaproteobacteria bacterium]
MSDDPKRLDALLRDMEVPEFDNPEHKRALKARLLGSAGEMGAMAADGDDGYEDLDYDDYSEETDELDAHQLAGLQTEEDRVDTGEYEDGDVGSLVFGGQLEDEDRAKTMVGSFPDPEEEIPLDGKTQILAVDDVAQQVPVLTIEAANSTSDVEIVTDRFVIGRSPDCDVVIPDQLVSRQHAVIERRGDGWYLVDQDSGNGTFINDERVYEEPLYDGDLIQVGDAAITFTAPGAEDVLEPAAAEKTRMLPAPGLKTRGTNVTGMPLSPAAGKRRKLLMLGGSLAAILLVAVTVKFVVFKPAAPKGPSPQELAAQKMAQQALAKAERDFAKVKELAREEKWLEAVSLVRQVAKEMPDNQEVQEYKTTIQHEAAVSSHIQEARKKLEANQHEEALKLLASVSPNSMQIDAVKQLKQEIEDAWRRARQDKARIALSEENPEEARRLAMLMLQTDPEDAVAIEIRDQADKAILRKSKPVRRRRRRRRRRRGSRRRPKPKSNFLLVGESLVSYRNAKLDVAVSLASSSGVSDQGVKTLKQFKSFYERGNEMSKNAGQSDQAIKFLKKAYSLDTKLGGGKGKINEQLRGRLAKVYFVKGVDAHTRNKYDKAYQSYTNVLKYKKLPTAIDRLRKLEMEAKKFYETAYVIKGSNPEKAVRHCKTVLGMVSRQNVYHGKCTKLISKVQGAAIGGSGSYGGDGF